LETFFGYCATEIRDQDGDSVPDLAVGAPGDYGIPQTVQVLSGATGVRLSVFSSPNPGSEKFGLGLVATRNRLVVLASSSGPGNTYNGAFYVLDLQSGVSTSSCIGGEDLDQLGSGGLALALGRTAGGGNLLAVGAPAAGPGPSMFPWIPILGPGQVYLIALQ
jgi:hypothetical protein